MPIARGVWASDLRLQNLPGHSSYGAITAFQSREPKRRKILHPLVAATKTYATECLPATADPSTTVHRPRAPSELPNVSPEFVEQLHRGTAAPRRTVSTINIIIEDLCRALHVASEQEMKDLLNCLILSESAYKVADMGAVNASKLVMRMKRSFPPGLVTIRRMQWSLDSVNHRYLVADDKDTLYVSFMGTKQRRDLVTNAAVLQEPLWPDALPDGDFIAKAIPAAHRGFLSRAKAVPIEGLFAHACQHGKRLVLTGHSLGGAVATLSVLRLLKQLPQGATPTVRCVTFACPAIGNLALAEYVRASGWEHLFQNYLIPEDIVPRLLASPEQSPEQVAAAAIAALQPEEAEHIGDEFVESTLEMFEDIFDAVTSDDPLQVPSIGSLYRTLDSVPPGLSRTRTLPMSSVGTKPGSSPRSPATPKALVPTAGFIEHDREQRPADRLKRRASDKELAIEAAKLFQSLECGDEDVLGTVELPEGQRPGASLADAVLKEEEERAEIAELRGEVTGAKPSAAAGSAKAGRLGRRFLRERLSSSEEVFFPWSANPLPSFARQFAGRALKTAGSFGRLKGRRLPFQRQKSNDEIEATGSFASGEAAVAGPMRPGQPERESQDQHLVTTVAEPTPEPSSLMTGFVGPALQVESNESSLPATQLTGISNIVPRQDVQGTARRWAFAAPNRDSITKLGENVGRAASGAARGAARIVSVPLRVAQRSYAVLGKQSFLSTNGVLPAAEGEAEHSFQKGLEGATASSRASALAFPGSRGASPSTIVSLQLPIAAARRRQPFLMHKMAFHRARILSIVECTLAEAGLQVPRQPYLDSEAGSLLSTEVSPPMQPARADVFLPYSLPGNEDLKTILEDLGTLSALPPMTSALKQSYGSQRFQWLKPWRWITGFGWQGGKRRGTVELTVQIRGTGLENCSSVQVQEKEQGIWCRTEILYRPSQPAPAEVYSQLGLHRHPLLRRAAQLSARCRHLASQATTVLDRTNAMGTPDCLLVKVYMPLEVTLRMEARLLQQTGEDSGLLIDMASDFRRVKLPLQVHGGGSWVISDIRSSSQSLNDWISQNITG